MIMKGKIIDMNKTDAFVSFENGTTMDVGISHLPKDSKVGDTIDINFSNKSKIENDRMPNIF